ncbi:MAG: fused MFS/spermidine synthase [Armatimonadetes bacterium]|nr:fused MFS/spermidine synthase [Armatimonadota bacterium]
MERREQSRPSPRRVVLVYFLLGFGSLIAQTVLLREFMVISYGNEMCIGALLAAWLFWIAVGAELGGRVAARTRRPTFVFLAGLLFAALTLPAEALGLRYARLVLDMPAGEYIPFLIGALYAAFVIFPFSFVVGFTFPLGLRLMGEEVRMDSSRVGWLWAAEAGGSLAGGLVFTFVLVGWVPPMYCLGLVMVALFVAGHLLLHPNVHLPGLTFSTAVMAAACLLMAETSERATVAARWRSFGTHTQLVKSVDSKYQNIGVSHRDDQYSLYYDGHYSTSFPDDYVPAVNAQMALAQNKQSPAVLVIGGGIEGLVTRLLDHGAESLDYVQLDPLVITVVWSFLSKEYRNKLSAGPVNIHLTDGRRYVKASHRRYDLVFLNLPDPSTAMLNRYYTVEFFREVRRILKPEGILAFTLSGSPDYVGEELAEFVGSVYFSLKQVFPYVYVCPQEQSFFYGTRKAGLLSDEAEALVRRRAKFDPPGDEVSSQIIRSYVLPGRFALLRNKLEEHRTVHPNTDLQPAAYYYYMLYSERLTNFRLSSWLSDRARSSATPGAMTFVLRALSKAVRRTEGISNRLSPHLKEVTPPTVYLIWTLVVVGGLTAIVGSRAFQTSLQAPAFIFTAFTTGFAAMTLEMVLLLTLQCTVGYLYHVLGLLVALFMFGFAAGSIAAARHLPRGRSLHGCVTTFQALLLALTLMLPTLLRGLTSFPIASSAAIAILMIIAGLFTGLMLPVVSALLRQGGASMERIAGQVDRADHLGASCGALLSVTLLIPILGVGHTCYLLAGLTGTSLVWNLASHARSQ